MSIYDGWIVWVLWGCLTVTVLGQQQIVDPVCLAEELVLSGKTLEDAGEYDAAKVAFQQALAADPNNQTADKELLKLQKKINRSLELARDTSNQARLTTVSQGWTARQQFKPSGTVAATAMAVPISMRNDFQIANKLRTLVIKEVNFNEATIEDAIQYLTEETRRQEGGGDGINFLVQGDKVREQSKTFSFHATNMPVGEVLRYVTNLAGVRYRVEEFAVIIMPLHATDEMLVKREFSVRATFFEMNEGLTDTGTAEAVSQSGTEFDSAGVDPVRKSLEARGVLFGEGATAVYNANTGILTVRNTQEQIDLIEELVTENQGEMLQVMVQAKLLEINQADLDSLSFNYALYGNVPVLDQAGNVVKASSGHVAAGTNLLGARGLQQSDGINGIINQNQSAGSAAQPVQLSAVPNRFAYSGVIDGNVFSMMIEALSQKNSADLLSAPSLVVNDGQQGRITVAREFCYPTAYDQPQISPNNKTDGNVTLSTAPTVIPAWPAQFETRPVGVVLTVKPAVTTDRKRVFIVIKPEITEFDGFINYGAQMYSTVDADGEILENPALINENVVNQPVFSVRTVENAQLEIQDGYTLVLGGLIREDISTVEDKVPVLGDIPLLGQLFRSKAEQSVKRNLLIFITVRILRPDGEPLNGRMGFKRKVQ